MQVDLEEGRLMRAAKMWYLHAPGAVSMVAHMVPEPRIQMRFWHLEEVEAGAMTCCPSDHLEQGKYHSDQ